jgi:hypothetical protein
LRTAQRTISIEKEMARLLCECHAIGRALSDDKCTTFGFPGPDGSVNPIEFPINGQRRFTNSFNRIARQSHNDQNPVVYYFHHLIALSTLMIEVLTNRHGQ